MERLRRRIQFVVAAGMMVTGVVACLYLVETRPVPARNDAFARILEVDVGAVEYRRERIGVIGYGTVRPQKQIEVVPLVSGKIIESHRDLAQGKVIPQGALLYKLDPTVFESRLHQAEAEIKRLEAILARYDEEAGMLQKRIADTEQMLGIDERDYLTTKRLYEVEHVGTQRDLDLTQLKYLRQKDGMTELRSRLAMIPHQKLDVQAQLDGARAKLQQYQYDLDATEIRCPFDARVEAVHAHESQVVTAHFSIATLTDMSAFELSVGIDPRDLRWLDPAVRPESLGHGDVETSPKVVVRWSLHGQRFTWEGRVTRFERVNEKTRTAQMVVEVRTADMKARVELGNDDAAPTLSIGMFCSAELPGRWLDQALMVPRHAVYDNQWVYVLEPDADFDASGSGHLARKKVAMLRSVGDNVLVDYRGREGTEECELAAGERVILSRLVKPVVGMKVMLRDHELAYERESRPAHVADSGSREASPSRGALLALLPPKTGAR